LATQIPIPLQAIIRATGQHVSCNVEDETVILSLKNGSYFGLDPIAAEIWELIQEPRRVGEVRDRLLEEYDVDPEQCTRDLLGLLDQLAAWDLVEVVGETRP
jgi:hypothetical protein